MGSGVNSFGKLKKRKIWISKIQGVLMLPHLEIGRRPWI